MGGLCSSSGFVGFWPMRRESWLASAPAYVLRRAVRGAGWWLLANALAWMLGMPIVFLGASTIGSGASGLGQFAPIWLAMVAAEAVVGAVHGWALVWLVRGDAA